MRKRGFTLIELLAVIVILAIIALIAVPIVINIINDSKKESINRSIELYLDHVQKMVAKEQMKNPTFNPSECEIKPEGKLLCGTKEIQIEMKGQMPTSGKITIKNNIINYQNVFYDNLYYHKNDKNIISITKHPKYAELIDDADNNNEISIGDKYAYQVSNNDIFNFYVLSFNENSTVNLIMDRNICEDGSEVVNNNICEYGWHIGNLKNSGGPDEAMGKLYNATRKWDNVPNMNLHYDDKKENEDIGSRWTYGYKEINISDGIGEIITKNNQKNIIKLTENKPIKSRLPKLKEMVEIGCGNDDSALCPIWLVENLDNCDVEEYSSNNKIEGSSGYWLISSYSEWAYEARNINSCGTIGRIASHYSDIGIGIRPVITVSKEDLQ